MAEAVGETGDAPADLADFIPTAGQGEDGVVDRLGEAIADAVGLVDGALVGDDALVGVVGVLVQPAGQGGAQVETDAAEESPPGQGRVALGGDALVPVGVRRRVRFARDFPG
jgi:hypothetical protein